jgi:hypothetical protein
MMILIAQVKTQNAGDDLEMMMDNGWRFRSACELSLLPLMTAMDMVAQKLVRLATEEEEQGKRMSDGKTYARTGKLLRIYDQAQEYILICLKNKRF